MALYITKRRTLAQNGWRSTRYQSDAANRCAGKSLPAFVACSVLNQMERCRTCTFRCRRCIPSKESAKNNTVVHTSRYIVRTRSSLPCPCTDMQYIGYSVPLTCDRNMSNFDDYGASCIENMCTWKFCSRHLSAPRTLLAVNGLVLRENQGWKSCHPCPSPCT